MRLARVLIIILSSFVLGCGQATHDWKWREFHSSDARIKASVPCDVAKTVKSFQVEPRPIKVYGFECKIDGFSFLISVKNHMDAFNPNTVANAFESNEFILKNMFGEIEKSDLREGQTPEGFLSRDSDVRLIGGGRVRSLVVVNEFATYEALVGITQDDLRTVSEKKLDFDSLADRYVRSIQIKE